MDSIIQTLLQLKTAILLARKPRKPDPSKEKLLYVNIYSAKEITGSGRAEGKTGGVWVNNLL